MRKKKDQSGRIAVIASVIVVLLISVSLFSLYSLAENPGAESTSASAADNSAMTSGNLLSKLGGNHSDAAPIRKMTLAEDVQEPENAADNASNEMPDLADQTDSTAEDMTAPAVSAASPEQNNEEKETDPLSNHSEEVQTEDAQGVLKNDSEEEIVFAEIIDPEEDIQEEVLSSTISKLYAGPDQSTPAAIEPAAVETIYEEPVYKESVYEETVYEESILEGPADEEPIYGEPVNDEPVYEEPKYEVSYTEEFLEEDWIDYDRYEAQALIVYDNQLDDSSWLYEESSYEENDWAEDESWENDSSWEEDNSWENDSSWEEDNSWENDNTWVEDNNWEESGEWVFDYDTEEWQYVEYGSGYESYEDAGWVDDSWEEDYSWENDNTWEEDGEWLFNYDTEEWYYAVRDDSDSYEDTGWADDRWEDSGEWVFDYDTEEWYYVESNRQDSYYEETEWTDDSWEENGEWIFDYDTEEWYYVDNSYDEYEDEWQDVSDGWDEEEEWYEEENTYYNPLGQQIVDYAMGFVGVTPYSWGGRSLYSGTDCSGFVSLIFDAFGIYCSPSSLAYNGSGFGYLISSDELQPGDIVVYGGGDHVAIYAGNGYVVHCSSPENGTVYWNMYYRSDISWFLRVL